MPSCFSSQETQIFYSTIKPHSRLSSTKPSFVRQGGRSGAGRFPIPAPKVRNLLQKSLAGSLCSTTPVVKPKLQQRPISKAQ